MATATLFNKVGNGENYTASVTIDQHRPWAVGYVVHVLGAGIGRLTIKNLDGETVWTGKTSRSMSPKDLAKFVQEITA